MKLSDVGERVVVNEIVRIFGINKNKYFRDDSAVIPLDLENYLLFTIDSISNIDIPPKTPPEYIGGGAVSNTLSDIAAMGGLPKYVVVSYNLPKHFTLDFVKRVSKGIQRVAKRTNCAVVGGDVNEAEEFTITIAAIGTVERKYLLLRSTASVGDSVCVVGDIGMHNVANIVYRNKFYGVARKRSIYDALYKPRPMFYEARKIAISGLATSCIDLTDGLYWGLYEISKASNVGTIIYEDHLPIGKYGKILMERLNLSIEDIVSGRGDFQLLFTVKKGKWNEFKAAMKKCKVPVFKIGEITRKRGQFIQLKNGEIVKMKVKGSNHFQWNADI